MARRADDWFRQAEADLAHARDAATSRHFEWACFAAQQAADKAVKAVHESLGHDARSHSVKELLEAFGKALVADESLLASARSLDKMYISTRYPNGLPAGAPADYYTATDAEGAIRDAEAILGFCRGNLQR